jgi:tight adherence protein C
MTTIVLLAGGVGVGLWLLAVWLFPPRPTLASLLARLDATPAPPPILLAENAGWAHRLGRPFIGLLRAMGFPTTGVAKDLAITGRSADTHLAEKAALALTGALLPALLELVLTLANRGFPWLVTAVAAAALALGGFLLPDLLVRAEAARRRTTFRHALSAYLDLIDILLAGGAGVDGALFDAASTGHGWSFQQIRRALTTARITRSTPWATLGQLGDELDITELSELAAALSLAGTEGAKVRASLAAKAEALRIAGGAEAEAKANSATERMTIPAALMAFGFIIFVFYPAMSQITGNL